MYLLVYYLPTEERVGTQIVGGRFISLQLHYRYFQCYMVNNSDTTPPYRSLSIEVRSVVYEGSLSMLGVGFT
jgi:hypothetical protein